MLRGFFLACKFCRRHPCGRILSGVLESHGVLSSWLFLWLEVLLKASGQDSASARGEQVQQETFSDHPPAYL